MTKRIDISLDDAGQRADRVVAASYPQYARSAVHKLFENGDVLMDGQAVKAGYKVRDGDNLFIEDAMLVDEPDPIELPVIYEDDDVIVINKPAGVLSHSKGSFNPEGTVASWLRQRTQTLMQGGGNRAGIVHRLDRGTSGVMVCAKHDTAQSWLQKQFSSRNVTKTYAAVIEGSLPTPEGVIDMPIGRNPAKPQTFHVTASGKPATTDYRTLKQGSATSLIELSPQTGRTHQLRVHLAKLGHPIVGDHVYGTDTGERLYLHAEALELTLPSRERKTFTAAVPPEFKKAVR